MVIVFWIVVGLGGALVVYLFTHNMNGYEALEREVAKIRHQGAMGWSTRRIRLHHPRFCECQIEYLCGRRTRHPV